MDALLDRYFRIIELKANSISNHREKLKYLLDLKVDIPANFSGDSERMLISRIDTLIEKETILASLPPQEEVKEIFIDYSENKFTERITFLYELGLLDFLRDKMKSELHNLAPNKLAEIVSTFMGIDQKTLASYFNPMYSEGTGQKNNPLNKNQKQVQEKISKIGLKTRE